MFRCVQCEGFIPSMLSACPHCAHVAQRKGVTAKVLAVIGAGAAAMTLMACYGMPPCDHNARECDDTTDAGPADGGTCDAGTSDGGC